mgnify:CR=1 FL=1
MGKSLLGKAGTGMQIEEYIRSCNAERFQKDSVGFSRYSTGESRPLAVHQTEDFYQSA